MAIINHRVPGRPWHAFRAAGDSPNAPETGGGQGDRLKEWKDRIAVHFLVQDEVQRHDRFGLWEYHYPTLAATEEQLARAEACLGHAIDKGYRDFLSCANGWGCFIQTVKLFGTDDLEGSPLMTYAQEMLKVLDDAYPLDYTGFTLAELLPIAATFEDRELHVISRPWSHQPGVVIWFDGEELERYPSFEEYFLSMTDYNRYEIESFKRDAEERGKQ